MHRLVLEKNIENNKNTWNGFIPEIKIFDFCLSLFPIAVIKTMSKNNLVWGLFDLHFHITMNHQSKSRAKLKRGTWSRNWSRMQDT